MSKKKVVVIGGGNGSAVSIVALKQNLDLFDISAVISMSDSGGSSGALRKAFNSVPPGDIMRAALALSKYDYPLLKQIFYRNRFDALVETNRKLNASRGPNLGNLFLMLVAQYEGDFMRALRALEQAVETVGHAYPVTLDRCDLVAELENGEIVKTEAALDQPSYDLSLQIKKVWLEPEAKILSDSAKTIKEADYIIFGPGSLYTSVIAAILPDGTQEAIKESRAKLIFVTGNAYIADGETCPRSLSGNVFALDKYLPRPLDTIVHNAHKLNKEENEMYGKKKWVLLEDDKENLAGRNLIQGEYEREGGGLCAIKLGKILKELLWK